MTVTIPSRPDGGALQGTDYLLISRAPHNALATNFRILGSALGGVAVTSLTGTANQVLVNATTGVTTTGAITLTLPQSIATTSNVQFNTLAIGGPLFGGSSASIVGASPFVFYVSSGGALSQAGFTFLRSGGSGWIIANNYSVIPDELSFVEQTSGTTKLECRQDVGGAVLINQLGGNLLVGTLTDDATNRLQVAGGTLTQTIKITTGATNGYVLKSDASGNASWANPTSLPIVTSLTGTANQIAVSASTGAVTLSLTDGISLGSLQATAPPTGGLLIPGRAIFRSGGSTVTSTFFQITPAVSAISGTAYGMFFGAGTITATASFDTLNLVSLQNTSIARAGFGGIVFRALNVECSNFIASGGGSSAVAFGIKVGGFVSHATSQYSAYFTAGTGGTINQAVFATNLAIGPVSTYDQVNPPTNGAIIAGPVYIGASSLAFSGASSDIRLNVENSGTRCNTVFQAYGTGFYPQINLIMARGVQGTPTATQSGDSLGFITARGFGATIYPGYSAYIGFSAAANFSDTSAPANIDFTTSPAGAISGSVGMRFSSTSQLWIGATSSQGTSAKLQTTNSGWNYSGSDGTATGGIYVNNASTQPVMFGSFSNHNIGFFTNNGNAAVTLTTSGDFGIGASSFGGKFWVVDSAGATFFDGSGGTFASANRWKSTTTAAGTGRDLVFVTDSAGTYPALYMATTGNVGMGTSSTTGISLNVVPTATSYYIGGFYGNVLVTDTGTTAGGQRGLYVVPKFVPTVNPTAGSFAAACVVSGTFSSPGGTLSNAYSHYVSCGFTNNAATITTMTGIFYDGGGSLPGGSIGTHYGLRIMQPVTGTNKYTAQFDPLVGMNNVPLSGSILRIFGGSLDSCLYMDGTITQNGNFGLSAALFMQTSIKPPSNGSCYGIYMNCIPDTTTSTVSNFFGVRISPQAKVGGNALTTAYSLYVDVPSGAGTNYCAFFAGPILFGVNTTGAGTALLGTLNCPAVTLSAPYVWIKGIAPDGSTIYSPWWK